MSGEPEHQLPEPSDDTINILLGLAYKHAQAAYTIVKQSAVLDPNDPLDYLRSQIRRNAATVHQVVAAAYLAAAGLGEEVEAHIDLGLDWLGVEPDDDDRSSD